MGTSAAIAVEHADGTISEVYLHWDGYIEHAGRMLVRYYNSLEAAEALVANGNISVLAESIYAPPGHSFDTPVRGHTVFYGRDRNDEDATPTVYDSYEEYMGEDYCMKYNYIFREGAWYFYSDDRRIERVEKCI